MKSYEEFDEYEKEIVKALATRFPHRYTIEEAERKVEEYYFAMDRVGWYWMPEDWAEKLDNIIQQGISPEEWLRNIKKIDQYPDDPSYGRNGH